MMNRFAIWVLGLSVCWIFVADVPVRAADVDSDVSTRETTVGLPVTLRIRISNAVDHEEPEFPEVDGLKIESLGAPARSTRISIVNGRRTQRTSLTYAFRVTPQREGTFTIPPIQVTADGLTQITKAVRIVAREGETDDLLFVELQGDKPQVYVGEPLPMTLKIWIRPFQDDQRRFKLDEGVMWNLISDQSQWGPFSKRLNDLRDRNQRPAGRSVLREDSEGKEREYYLYEIDTTIYPDRAEQIDGGDIRIVLRYPTQIGRSRSPFSMLDDDFFSGSSLLDDSFFGGPAITDTRPLVGVAEVEPVTVKPVPQEGRPASYRGAVGQFDIAVEAKPRKVSAGDPITLHLDIAGEGSLERLPAPPLQEQADLERDFKVPDESLAGIVQGPRKRFTTTIRPRNDDVSQIPPIEFSYFDPELEQFVTKRTEPIAIEVDAAEQLALDAIIGSARGETPSTSTLPTATSGGLPEAQTSRLLTGPGMLHSLPRRGLLPDAVWVMLIVPPLLTALITLVVSRGIFRSLLPNRTRLRRQLAGATTSCDVAEALEQYLIRLFEIQPGRNARDQAIGCLRSSGQVDLAVRSERLFATCERNRYEIVGDALSLQRQIDEATAIAEAAKPLPPHLARRRKLEGGGTEAKQAATVSTFLLVTLLASAASAQHASAANTQAPRADANPTSSTPAAVTPPASRSLSLTPEQQAVLLREALAVDFSARGAEAEAAIDKSIRKLLQLVASGIDNDRLHYNLGLLAERNGEVGLAIASYRRALQLQPDRPLYRDRLFTLERSAGLEPDGASTDSSWSIAEINRRVLDRIPISPVGWLAIMVVAWSTVWIAVTLRLLGITFPWKRLAAAACLLALVAGSLYSASVLEFVSGDHAVVLADSVKLRSGDDRAFEVVREWESAEGHLVRLLNQRGEWMEVELPDGLVGWLQSDTVARI